MPEVYDVTDDSLSLRWNTVDVPAFSPNDEPLMFVIERQILPDYEWEPVATHVTDKSYTVRDLQPYQDYNFRVRGIYPSGYSEPSPHVPVYRRPSESKLGIDDSFVEIRAEQSSVKTSPPSLPSKSLQSSIPAIYIRKPRPDLDLDRRYSTPNIYASAPPAKVEPTYRKGSVPDPKFKREEAYVYRRSRSPTKKTEISERFVTYFETQVAPKKKPQKGYDLYEWYLRQRRYSDVGLEELRRMRSPGADVVYDGRRMDLIFESQRKSRKPSLSTIPQRKVLEITETSNKEPSVADRIEDIKTPYVVQPGHWRFPRRHSIAVDPSDLVRIKRLQQQVQTAKMATDKKNKPKSKPKDLEPIAKMPDEYFSGVPFRVEDEVHFKDIKPKIKAKPVSKPRSMSVDMQPGYFVISKFSVAVTGVKKTAPRVESAPRESRYEGRSASPDYRRWAQTRSMTPDMSDIRRQARSYTPDIPDFSDMRTSLKHRSLSLVQEIERSKGRRPSFARYSRERSLGPSSPSRYASPSPVGRPVTLPPRRPSPPRSYQNVKPRSYSISVPPSEGKFNKNVEVSKSLISNYATLQQKSTNQLNQSRASSVAPTKNRSMSIADLRSDRRFSTSRRASSIAMRPQDVKSDARFTTQPRGSLSVNTDVKNDLRYSVTPRGSNVSLKPPGSDVKSDPRYSSTPRGSMSQVESQFVRRRSSVAMHEDIKSKLDSTASKLTVPSSKPKKSRPVMKFKSSKGEGAVY